MFRKYTKNVLLYPSSELFFIPENKNHFIFSVFSYLLFIFYSLSPLSPQISFYVTERNTAVPAFSELTAMLGIQ